MKNDFVDEGMSENVRIRMFSEMKSKIDAAQEQYPQRWSNSSHFTRAAILHYLNHLEKEEGIINKM